MSKYTHPCKCPHCPDGQVKWFSAGDRVMLWCDTCGGNSPEKKPSVELSFSKGKALPPSEGKDL